MKTQHKYNNLDLYLKNRFGKKVFKVALNGDFSCPNIDGTISSKGCSFCSNSGGGEFAGDKTLSIKEQFDQITQNIHKKWPDAYYIPYFQANTNTYGPIDKLRSLYYQAINTHKNVVALSIATRPDSISKETLLLLKEINQKIPLWIELGLQTIHEETAIDFNRGYNLQTFIETVAELRRNKIEVIVHIVNGLPKETKSMMLETAHFLNSIDIQGVKIHNLFLLKNTSLGDQFLKTPFEMLSLNQYIDITTEQLAILNPNIVIHRINGDPKKEDLIEPKWCLKKLVVMNEIDRLMKEKKYYQGCLIK
ncbi:MAG: TIGR01212 family radical SAM protein [Bacilli bacterium]|nr:TIGR01212 family radical SAM protein [Bacilli bacterium]